MTTLSVERTESQQEGMRTRRHLVGYAMSKRDVVTLRVNYTIDGMEDPHLGRCVVLQRSHESIRTRILL